MENQLQLLQITNVAKNHLIAISKWGLFLSITNFILAVITACVSLFMGKWLELIMANSPQKVPPNIGAIIGVYIFFAFLIALPAFFLFNFSRNIKKAINLEDDRLLESSLSSLSTYFLINGIMMILYLGFIALMGVGIIAAFKMGLTPPVR